MNIPHKIQTSNCVWVFVRIFFIFWFDFLCNKNILGQLNIRPRNGEKEKEEKASKCFFYKREIEQNFKEKRRKEKKQHKYTYVLLAHTYRYTYKIAVSTIIEEYTQHSIQQTEECKWKKRWRQQQWEEKTNFDHSSSCGLKEFGWMNKVYCVISINSNRIERMNKRTSTVGYSSLHRIGK